MLLSFCCEISHNLLRSLPVELFTLKNLRCLVVQQNLLEELPEEVGQLVNLTELVTFLCSFFMYIYVVCL